MWRKLFIIAAIICCIVAGAVIALKSRRVADNLKAYLVRQAHDQFGVTLAMADLEVELLPPGISVNQVIVQQADSVEPWITLHRGRLLVRPWPSAAGAFVIHNLELDGLRGDIDLRGRDDLLRPGGNARSHMAVDIRELSVWNTFASLRTDDFDITIERGDCRMRPSLAGRQIEVRVGNAILRRDDHPVSFELQTRGLLRGSVDRPERLEIVRGLLALRGVTLSATGGVSLTGSQSLDAVIEAHAPLGLVNQLTTEAPQMGGNAEIRIEVSGSTSAPKSRVHLLLTDLVVERKPLGTVEIDATHTPERIAFDSVRVSHPIAGSVTGSGVLNLDESLSLELNARLHSASLPHVLDLADMPDTWVPVYLNADVQGSGSFNPFRLNLELGGTVERFAVLNDSYRNPDAVRLMSIPEVGIEGSFYITRRAITFDHIALSRNESILHVEGPIYFDASKGIDLRAWTEHIQLADIGAIASVEYEGKGALAATIQGPLIGAPIISATLELDDFAVQGFFLGDIKSTLVFSDPTLPIGRATVKRNEGTVEASGAFNFATEMPRVHGEFAIKNINISDVLETLEVDESISQRFHARVDGSVSLSGPVTRPAGLVAVSGPDLRINNIHLGRLAVHGGFFRGNENIWSEFQIEPKKGKLDGRVAWLNDDTLEISGDAVSVPLALAQPFFGNPEIEGRLTGKVSLHGPNTALSGTIDANVAGLVVSGVRLETASLGATLERGKMKVTGTTLGNTSRVDATIALGEKLPFTATATYQRLELGRLIDLPANLNIVTTGTMFAQGDMTDPENVIADLHVEAAVFEYDDLELRSLRPIRLEYAGGLVRIEDMIISGNGLQLSAAGHLYSKEGVNLQILGVGDLRPSIRRSANLDWLRGRFDVGGRITGQYSSPKVTGNASLSDAALRLPGTGQILEKINTKLVFSGRTVTVETGSAILGGGTVRFAGSGLLPVDGESQLNLRADLDSVTLYPMLEVQTVVSGNLNLIGPLDGLALRGRLKLDSLRYSANFDLNTLVPKSKAPLRVTTLNPSSAIELGVAIYAPNNIIISNNVVDAELRADLTITGTTERVGLVGSITPIRAKARHGDNEFVVHRGTIDFTEEFRIFTQFDLHATTEACKMKIGVNVHGDSDHVAVSYRGEDDNGRAVDQNEVSTCILVGMRQQDIDRLTAATSQNDAANALSNPLVQGGLDVLWTVSGMDAKVRKLLPIKLDRVRLESAWSPQFRRTTTRVLVGKDLGSDVQLEYARSIEEVDDQALRIEYQLSGVAALEGNWLSAGDVSVEDFGLDLRLRWEFE